MHAAIQEEIDDRMDLAAEDGLELSTYGALCALLDDIGCGFRSTSLRRHTYAALVELGYGIDCTELVESGLCVVTRGKPYAFKLNGRYYDLLSDEQY